MKPYIYIYIHIMLMSSINMPAPGHDPSSTNTSPKHLQIWDIMLREFPKSAYPRWDATKMPPPLALAGIWPWP